MSSSGGGEGGGSSGILDGISDTFKGWSNDNGSLNWENIGQDILQPIRLGIHYDFKSGKLKDSSTKRLEDVTGRSAAKKVTEKKQNAINEEKTARAREADLLWLDNYRRDVAGSTQAQAVRTSADARSRVAGGTAPAQKLGTSEELLGV